MWLLYVFFAYCLWKLIELALRYPWIPKVTNRHVLVTGCDTGFGHEIAKELDRLRVTVYAGCYTESGEKLLRETCSSRVKPFSLDISNDKSIEKAFEFVSNDLPEGKGLWGIINNAGIPGFHMGPIDWLNVNDHRQTFSVNYFGMVSMTNTFLPLLKKEKGSRIINTASILGRMFIPFAGPYTATKHAIEAFSNVLRNEIRPFDISVHIIEPAIFLTPMSNTDATEKTYNRTWDRLPKDKQEDYGELYFENLKKGAIDGFVKMGSPDFSPVINAYKHALLGQHPKHRYLVGKLSTFFWLMMLLPDWIVDLLNDPAKSMSCVPACSKQISKTD